jgi:hypothetical protein
MALKQNPRKSPLCKKEIKAIRKSNAMTKLIRFPNNVEELPIPIDVLPRAFQIEERIVEN